MMTAWICEVKEREIKENSSISCWSNKVSGVPVSKIEISREGAFAGWEAEK